MRDRAPSALLDTLPPVDGVAGADSPDLNGDGQSIELTSPGEASHSARTVEQPGIPARDPQRERVELGTVVGGRYRVSAFVAEGAFGAVYRADDIDISGHVVALKLMHRPSASDDEHARCLREVQLIAAVSHPSVVSFKDHGLHRGRFYIVMPWYQGETLAQRLDKRGALSRSEAQRIFTSLAEALAAMHERGVRHQDVKPENILLARLGEGQEDFPVLLDLGVGAFRHEQLAAFTAAYVAPEMARAHLAVVGSTAEKVDGKADVFALALTLFDALLPGARDLPTADATQETLVRRASLGADIPWSAPLRDIHEPLSRWLSLDARDRPSARELAHELSALTREQLRREERKRLWWKAGPALCVVAALVAILGVQLRTERVRSQRKDIRIEQQEIGIGQAREAIDALSGARRATLQDYLDLKRRAELLERELVGQKDKTAQLDAELGAERLRASEEQARISGTADRVLLLEKELAEAEQRFSQAEEQKNTAIRELARVRRSFEGTQVAMKNEKSDLASLVRELVKERDQLTERVSELARTKSLLAKRAEAAAKLRTP